MKKTIMILGLITLLISCNSTTKESNTINWKSRYIQLEEKCVLNELAIKKEMLCVLG